MNTRAHLLSKTFSFQSAHYLPNVPLEHKCGSMHGHSYRVTVCVAGLLEGRLGWVVDFAVISEAFEPLRQRLDHQLLNSIEGLENPTSELLAQWLYSNLAGSLPGLVSVTVAETESSSCTYEPGRW